MNPTYNRGLWGAGRDEMRWDESGFLLRWRRGGKGEGGEGKFEGRLLSFFFFLFGSFGGGVRWVGLANS